MLLAVGQEPPPLHRLPNGHTATGTAPGHTGKAKGKPARRKTGDRFAVLNAFVDFTMQSYRGRKSLVWLVLVPRYQAGRAGANWDKPTWHAGPG